MLKFIIPIKMNTLNVNITTFVNPYSFFCVIKDSSRGISVKHNNEGHITTSKSISDVNHGQYVAVMWKNRWTRGVITMESQFLIWLIDYGIYIHPDDRTVYIDLPLEYRKHPTKVFEAAIHGVVPLDKYINDELEINSKISSSWNKGAIEKCQELLRESINTYFVPLALMTTKFNDIVLGDLYLEIPAKKIINLIDELELWPVFLEKKIPTYVKNLSKYYITRHKHRACVMKPDFANISLPVVSLQMTLDEYNALTENRSDLCLQIKGNQSFVASTDGDTDNETEIQDNKTKNAYCLTTAEIEKYANLYITVHGQKYNVLNVLVNKARDLRLCDRYKDLKSIGRGCSFKGPYKNDCYL